MRTLLLNGSPKKKLSTSRYIQKTLQLMLGSSEKVACSLRNQTEIEGALKMLEGIDALVITAPLYIDSMPSHLLKFLQAAEKECKDKGYHFKVYVLINSGFIEGCQNEVALAQYQCWTERAGLIWGGGVGIGGGVILGFYTLAIPIAVIQFIWQLVINMSSGGVLVTGAMVSSFLSSIGCFLFFSIGMFICEWLIVRRIKKNKQGNNLYTRFMIPSILFLICADVFMMILCIVKGGLFRNVCHREKLAEK